MKKQIFTSLIAISLASVGQAQFFQFWAEAYNGTAGGQDRANCLVVDKRGCTYVAGESARTGTGLDYVIVKYGPFGGAPLWVAPVQGVQDGKDIPRALAIDEATGAVYVTGESQNGPSGQAGNRDFLTVKLDGASGAILWAVRHPSEQDDYATDLAINKDGHVFVVGTTQSTTGSPDILTIRYDQDGNIVSGWPVTHDDNNHNDLDVGVAIAVGPSDNVFITGQTSRGAGDVDWITIRYTGAGAFQWKRYVHGTSEPIEKDDGPTDIVVDAANNVFVCGHVYNGTSNTDAATVSYNVDGADRWNVPGIDRALEYTSTPGAGADAANALDIEIDNMGVAANVFVTGYGGQVGNSDYLTLAYSAALNTSTHTWARDYDGTASLADFGKDVAVAEMEICT